MSIERQIAGLWCHEVADRLEAYVGGRLDPAERARVQEHVAACSQCASFGARYASLIEKARGALADPETEDAVLARVRARLPRTGAR